MKKSIFFLIKVLTDLRSIVLLNVPAETDQGPTADGSWGESGGRERRAKASLRVDDKKELSEPPRGKERILKELKRISL